MATGYRSEKKDWNPRLKEVRSSHPNGLALRDRLRRKVFSLLEQLDKAEQKNYSYKQAIEGAELPTFSKYWNMRKEQLMAAGDLGNYRFYNTCYKDFHEFMGSDEVTFSELNYTNLKKYEVHLDARGLANSTMKIRFKVIKAVYNDARRNYPDLPSGVFEGIMQGRTVKGSLKEHKHLSLEELRKFWRYETKLKARERAKDFWFLALALHGAYFIDVAYLEPKKIEGEYLVYYRGKMLKKQVAVKVKVTPFIRSILEKYQHKKTVYLHPHITVPRNDARLLGDSDIPLGTKQFDTSRRNLDRALKQMASELKLPRISMGMARHSFVVAARDLGFSKELIEQAIGHQGNSVMDRHYFGRYDQQLIDEMASKVFEAISI